MKLCDRAGCETEAQWQVAFKMWAHITPVRARTDKNCLHMLSSVCICEVHKLEVKSADDFFTDETREAITNALDATGMYSADFDNIALEFTKIVGEPVDVTRLPDNPQGQLQ